MKDAQKPDHASLATLIGHLREGRYVIPDFQREFEWEPWDIRDLIRSIFLDYYIGSLLLWKGKQENFEALACEPVYGHSEDDLSHAHHIVLDGQQRLTAMYYTFLAPDVPLPNRSNRYLYFIHVDRFMDQDYDAAFEYGWTRRAARILASPETQYSEHIFPLSVVGGTGWELPNWVQGYEAYWNERHDGAVRSGDAESALKAKRRSEDARAFGEHLKGITQQYQVAYIELDQDLDISKVCDIFTQVNSKGVRLDAFDLINAMLKPKGLQLKHMWREAAPRLDFVETDRMNVYLLQVMSIRCQTYCSPKYLYYLLPGQVKKVRESDGSLRQEVLVPDTTDFRDRWNSAVDAVESAIALLRHPQEFGAISSRYLPYVSIIPAFASLQCAVAELDPHRQLDAQKKVRHWYWSSVFTSRYSGSVESTAARDYTEVRKWFDDDEVEPAVISEFGARFRALDLRRETKRGTSVYNGVFNLFVLHGARDWMTGTVPQYGDLDDHHIVPKRWGRDHDLAAEVDTILNRTPLTADTNRRVISDRLPNEYLPELILKNGESTVRATLESHFISPAAFDILLRDPFTPEDLEDFLSERQRTIQDAIEGLLIKERLDLSPRLQELDADLEQVELAIRSSVAEAVQAGVAVLPPHVVGKLNDRIRAAAQRNAAIDQAYYARPEGMLEFADLRDLEDTIKNRDQWPVFAQTYGSKETLATRFSQLAELRNGIRHSRAVDEVTRKDGEAAILWFRKVLGSEGAAGREDQRGDLR